MKKKQEAIQLFEEGFNCSQAVLGAFSKDLNLDQEMALKIATEFTNRFKEEQGSIVCKDLLGYDLSKPEEYQILIEQGKFKTDCPQFIRCAVELLENM